MPMLLLACWVLGLASSCASDLGALTGVIMGVGVAGVQTPLDQRKREHEIRSNQLYFYYGARELLGDNGR